MILLLSECLRIAQNLLRPEDSRELGCLPPACARPLAGVAKALVWIGAAVLLGLGLGQLR